MTDVYSEKRVREIVSEEVDEAIEKSSAIAGLKSDVQTLKSDVGTLKSDVDVLKSDVGVLKSDVGVLKSDVGTLKSDVGVLKSDVGSLKFETHRLGVLLEDNTGKLDTVLELLSGSMKTSNHVDTHEGRIATLENNQELLTKTVKSHSEQLKATN